MIEQMHQYFYKWTFLTEAVSVCSTIVQVFMIATVTNTLPTDVFDHHQEIPVSVSKVDDFWDHGVSGYFPIFDTFHYSKPYTYTQIRHLEHFM